MICEYEMHRVGQNRIYTPYMTVYLVISLPKIPYTHRIYMVLANPRDGGLIPDQGIGCIIYKTGREGVCVKMFVSRCLHEGVCVKVLA